jgi:predicted TIM-barrel fold metal-dependent hydrolase
VSPGFPAYADLLPVARAMIEAAPERVVWGSDWPHASARECMPDDADLVDLLADWAGDEATLHRIVVTNPERLYGFAPM